MASKAKSRWADDEADAALDAQLKKQKEEKKRLKAQKAVQRNAERQIQETVVEAAAAAPAPAANDAPKLLRFEGGSFGRSRTLVNYDKLNDIGQGAYGFVSRAKEVATGQVFALKRLKFDPSTDTGGVPVTAMREIQVLKACDHRNVVKMKEVVVGEETGRVESIFLVLEFVEHDLHSILHDMPQPFLASEVKTLLQQLASGVAYLHEHWILHRDLKTSNILLNNRGGLKIADFGMARLVGNPPPQLTQHVVTLWYRAPELLLGETRYTSAIDLWSVGCVFGELLTHKPLLAGTNEVDQLAKTFELCGVPTDDSWPGFRRLPTARSMVLPPSTSTRTTTTTLIRAKFPLLTSAGAALLASLLSLDPSRRPTASEMVDHEYFRQDPKPKQEELFPTFPSKAGQERPRPRETPEAPARGQRAPDLRGIDFSGIFQARPGAEKGAGFSLRMV